MKVLIRLVIVIIAIFFIDMTVYAYTEYKIGDVVPYNGINYYVIKDSNSKDDSVTMLKAEPLTVEEVNTYGGVGTANNHVNAYNCSKNSICYQKTSNNNGYGGMAYYSSTSCGYDLTGNLAFTECKNDYASSEIKYVVDAWKSAKASAASEARLITLDEVASLGYERKKTCPTCGEGWVKTEAVPTWLYDCNNFWWTMTSYNDSESNVWFISNDGSVGITSITSGYNVVRPVITLSKTALGDTDESIVDNTDNDDKGDNIQSENKSSDDKKETTTKVKVGNTYMRQTLIIMIIGFISICSGVVIFYIIKNKKIISRRYL